MNSRMLCAVAALWDIPSVVLAQAEVQINVGAPPPAARVEVQPAQPYAGAMWVAGHWRWEHGAYAWRPGHWARPPGPGYVWVSAEWVRRGGAWYFRDGHWKPGAVAVAPAPAGVYAPPPAADVAVQATPPAPRVEVQPAAPYAGAVWIGGYWAWAGNHYDWVPGTWSAPRPGHLWVAGHWKGTSSGWKWVPGHWRPV